MENILALIVPVLIAIFVIKLLLSQVKLFWKLAVNSISGFICLWLLNLASGLTGIVFEINFITALVVGFLGIPGILLLLVFQFLRYKIWEHCKMACNAPFFHSSQRI